MGLEKSQRILILLAIDTVFFFVELITGYAVHSLALVADAFHMLNDVLSLCVGYWAVKIAQSGSSNNYTYGWQRAETLGALVNGVFLVALCVTIFLEAIQRFVEKPNVSNPKLVLIVGCVGLASNILGLFLFHEHSHGPGGHSHGDEEQGHAHAGHTHSHAHGHGAEDHDHADHHTHDDEHRRAGDERSPLMAKSHSHDHASKNYTEPDGDQTTPNGVNGSMRRKSVSGRRRRQSAFGSVENINFHPASFRNDIIQAARLQEEDIQEESERPEGQYTDNSDHGHGHSHNHRNGSANKVKNTHKHHKHNQPKEDKKSGAGHGHSHEDLNMKGVFLHVMGDALGNIGVIVTALIIWLAKFPGRFYFDPAISLVITVIILTSAIPLCKAASRILLQAVPTWVSIDEIREDIQDLEQVIEVHHLHVWQLSGDKLVASLHVKVNCEVQGEEYMRLAREIRACLHGHGIHSSTIQPEFMKEISGSGKNTANASGVASPKNPAADTSNLMAADGKAAGEECALECGPECDGSGQCCPRGKGAPGEGLMR